MTNPVVKEEKAVGPGFQGSDTTHAEVTVYASSSPYDPVLRSASKKVEFTGQYVTDGRPTVIGISTNKGLGGGAGTWTAQVKAPALIDNNSLEDLLIDDAWVDIVLYKHNRPWHLMRGTIDSVRKSTTVRGATSIDYVLTGRDFQKQYELTPIWFNKYIREDQPLENIAGSAAMRVFNSINVAGSVSATVQAFLDGFLRELGNLGRANWQVGLGMPNLNDQAPFIDNVVFRDDYFTNDPPRIAIHPSFMDPDGAGAWAMAQEWSDPTFCELFTDLTLAGEFGVATGDRFDPSFTEMTVILRDRPFPTKELGDDSPWFSLPLAVVPRQSIVADDLTRGGQERYNAFFVSPQLTQELVGNAALEVTAPLWNSDDIIRHGLRRFDIMSRYRLDLSEVGSEGEDALLAITKNQRLKVRDWYCLNPYLWNGSIALAIGRPDIRVGYRVRVPGASESEDMTFYVEQVGLDWQFGRGARTTLGVTRGWRGSDSSYMDALYQVADRYGGNRQEAIVSTGTAVA